MINEPFFQTLVMENMVAARRNGRPRHNIVLGKDFVADRTFPACFVVKDGFCGIVRGSEIYLRQLRRSAWVVQLPLNRIAGLAVLLCPLLTSTAPRESIQIQAAPKTNIKSVHDDERKRRGSERRYDLVELCTQP
jgi:hypothetical protein